METQYIRKNNGNTHYYADKQMIILHRTDGPAIEYADGNKQWWVEDKRHRLDGPAVEHADGSVEWWVEDKRHRTDGPAVEHVDGSKEWWVEDKRMCKADFDMFMR
jgi:hypothetical protein